MLLSLLDSDGSWYNAAVDLVAFGPLTKSAVGACAVAVSVSGPIYQDWTVDQSTLQQCEEFIKYKFSDHGLLSLALTHASVAPTRVQSNERMEFLGDSVLGLVVCSTLYERHVELLEGEMTRIKSAVVSRQTCCAVA